MNMIILCSINDVRKYAQGTVYRTSVGSMRGMDRYKGLEFLYPTWEMVMGHKSGKLSDQEYKDAYRKLYLDSWKRWMQLQGWLKSLRTDEDCTLLCYCAEGEFCHRRIIGTMIKHYRPDIEVVVH
jgi:hypothetical protein